jgi:hypothetical protein
MLGVAQTSFTPALNQGFSVQDPASTPQPALFDQTPHPHMLVAPVCVLHQVPCLGARTEAPHPESAGAHADTYTACRAQLCEAWT